MKDKSNRTGFTLIEMLVAMGIIVTIVSMVYGSYFATSKSVEAYKTRMTLSQDVRDALQQMARQIRCSYAVKPKSPASGGKAILPKTKGILESPVNYFKGDSNASAGVILQLVTTSRLSLAQERTNGLLDVAYNFDPSTGTLFVSQRSFVHIGKDADATNRNWSPLIESVDHIELMFFDGGQWLGEWDFTKKKQLPGAVRINITCEDENRRRCSYDTIAYICSRKNRKNEPSS
jgi:prepilin-type N-terminal cleavage/methylation domain-containing protein